MISDYFKKLLRLLWLLPGFLLWASFPPMGEHTDCLFALAPLLWLSRRADLRTGVRRWFLNGCVYWVATLAWMPAIVKNGGPWPLVLLGWFALAAYCALYFAAFGYLVGSYWRWARGGDYWRRLLGLLIVEPLCWAGLELVRSRFLGGFAWNQLGVAPVNIGFGAPVALGGVYLVSAMVVLVNGTVASIAERMWKPDPAIPKWLRSIETFIPLLLIYFVYSAADIATTNHQSPTTNHQPRRLSVALVQRNFPCCFAEPDQHPLAIYSNLVINVSALNPELVVLAESAMAEFGPVDHRRAHAFADWLMELSGASAVLAGGSRREAEGRLYNSAALYTRAPDANPAGDASAPQIYDKVHLVPFGEYIPLDDLIPALKKLAPVGSCAAGEAKLLELPLRDGSTLKIGVAICFEDTDSALVREFAARGAELLVFITNDSWFSHSEETVQHAWQAAARALETGLPIVRVGNSGVTGVIYPDGRATWLAGADSRPLVDARGTLFERVEIAATGAAGRPATPYVRYGDLPLASLFALFILTGFLIKYKAHYEQRRKMSLRVG